MRLHPSVRVAFAWLTAVAIASGASAAQRPPAPGAAARQASSAAAQPDSPPAGTLNADEMRQTLEDILNQYPPSLPRVIRLDPTLLQNEAYLQSYPALAGFLRAHPDVIHNPTFFFGTPDETRRLTSQDRALDMWRGMVEGVMVTAIVFTGVTGLIWLIKTFIDYRRWARLAKIQTDVHNKLLDRFTSNEDLLAYIQTPAGRRFLEAAPLPMESPRSLAAPFGRILWSAQAGAVLTVLGMGLEVVAQRSIEEIAGPLSGIGAIVIALGIGFVVSGFLAYVLSRRFGLVRGDNAPEARG